MTRFLDDDDFEALELPTRIGNCLRFELCAHGRIMTIGEVRKFVSEHSEAEILRIPNLGRKSVTLLLALFPASTKYGPYPKSKSLLRHKIKILQEEIARTEAELRVKDFIK